MLRHLPDRNQLVPDTTCLQAFVNLMRGEAYRR